MVNSQWHQIRRVTVTGTAAALLFGGLVRLTAAPAPAKPEAVIGKPLGKVKLKDTTGKTWAPAELKDQKATVLVFIGTNCPIANNYAAPLSELAAKYGPKGVQFLGVNSNPEEKLAEVTEHAQEYRYTFPVLKDEKQELADTLGARVTPEAFVLDEKHVVRYRGRIDDTYASRTKKRNKTSSRDLELALDAVLAGKPAPVAVTQALGCAIPRPEKNVAQAKVTYHKDVAGILQERCQSCHRPGQVAPFSLLTYADAKNWAAEIKEFTVSRQMPPWKAEPGYGEFAHPRRMSDAEIATLTTWVDAGAPQGNPKDAPPARQWPDDWALGKPDLVLKVSEAYNVSATGEDDFRCFVLPTNLTEDRQVIGVEIRPGNSKVVHHVLNFVDSMGRARKLDEKDAAPGYSSGLGGVGFLPSGALGGWAPGNMPRFLPAGSYWPLAKGSDIVMQVHYHKTGKPEADQTSIGIYFAKEPMQKQARTLPLTNLRINIPPNEARHPVTASMTTPSDVHIFGITPHMHLLGREMKVTATFPDGSKKELVWIKDWDYRWQDTYLYKEPIALPRGTRVDMTAYFDNTSANPLNPNNPPQLVRFGEQTTDEMCFAFIEFTYDKEPAGFNFGALLGAGLK